jgi:membrane protease YdiL (CAAX protease family)
MIDILSHLSLYRRSPLIKLIVSLLIVLVLGMLLMILMYFAGTLIFELDTEALSEDLLDNALTSNIDFLRYFMILQDICLFIIPSIIILILIKPSENKSPFDLKIPKINEIALVVLLAFCLFPITSFTGVLNSSMHLPGWLSEVENWMTEKEDYANNLLELLIASNTFWMMLLNLLMIAVLPAIGEELIFRGVFQKILCGFFRSGHAAIWITAFVFSAIHLQFFGLIPRFILGLAFGYLYFWSGTLWLPVIAHFINNAVPVVAEYIKGADYIASQGDVVLWKHMIGLPVPIIAGGLILWYFRNNSKLVSDDKLYHSGTANE